VIVSPVLELPIYYHCDVDPDLVIAAVTIALPSGCAEIALLRKGQRLGGSALLSFDLMVVTIVPFFALIDAGTVGEARDTYGSVPYIMALSAPGSSVEPSPSLRGWLPSGVAGVMWAILLLRRGTIICDAEGHILRWVATETHDIRLGLVDLITTENRLPTSQEMHSSYRRVL
jgi:hypothetical protein